MTTSAISIKEIKPNQSEIELFKKELAKLLGNINLKESEEFHKNLLKDFLNAVYYKDKHYINTKGKNDLVISRISFLVPLPIWSFVV